jgi:hypothetical protein
VYESDPKKLSLILRQMDALLKGQNVRLRHPQEIKAGSKLAKQS